MEIEKIALPQQVTRFFKEVRAELKKVTWTGRKEVLSGTIAVLVLSGIISLFLWVIDFGLSQAVRLVLGLG
jgi:preprotein translocase subunit SecE